VGNVEESEAAPLVFHYVLALVASLALRAPSMSLEVSEVRLQTACLYGSANGNGICLTDEASVFFFDTAGSFKAKVSAKWPNFIEAYSGGFCVSRTLFDSTGKAKGELPFVPYGMNSKGEVCRSISNGEKIQEAAYRTEDGVIHRIGPKYGFSDIDGYENQAMEASKCWDIDDDGNVLFTAFEAHRESREFPKLPPYFGKGTKYVRLALPSGEEDAYPLKFGFDGSIIGTAYPFRTIFATGWSGGFGVIDRSDAVVWHDRKPVKLVLGQAFQPKGDETGAAASGIDCSGGLQIGKVAYYGPDSSKPTRVLSILWVQRTAFDVQELVKAKGLQVKKLIGFVSPRTFAAIGNRGSESLLLLITVSVKSA